MKKIYLDTETRSEVDIGAGVKAYVRGSFFQVIMVQYAIDEGAVQIWEPASGEPMPSDLKEAIALPKEERMFVIHNSVFDRNVINHSGVLGVQICPEEIIDVMVQALAHGFPGGLGALSEIFGLPVDKAKDRRGTQLINMFCKPWPRLDYVGFHNKETRPQEWEEFRVYGERDVAAMREVHRLLPGINYPKLEHHLWVIDQRINDRGIPVDVELATAAVEESKKERLRLNRRTQILTRGEVDAATKRDALLASIAKLYGIELPNLRSGLIRDLAASDELPRNLRELLSVREQSSMNSAAKYRRILSQEVDGRMCYTMQMYGASRTGRDAGRGLQPQNLRRAMTWKKVPEDRLEEEMERDFTAITGGYISLYYDNVMDVLSDSVRSVIKAKPGHKLVVADYSNIEGRGISYLAGEDWKLDYFRKFDAGEIKFDNYRMAYANTMNVPVETTTKENRQIGKVQELALGYEGGVKALLSMVAINGLDIDVMADAVWNSGDLAGLQDAAKKFDWALKNGHDAGLSKHAYAACEYLKAKWRQAHPSTVALWAELKESFYSAMTNQGKVFVAADGKLKFKRQGSYLYIRLPSGRCLVYLRPKLDDEGNLSFEGVDGFTRKFKRIKTYSGKLAENVTSAFARDIMFYHLPHVEEAGYRVVMRVHDELVCEVPDTPEYNCKELGRLMTLPLEWHKDMPLAASGFEAHRYRKD
ncbi:MAG: hypothetical protein NC080_07325 [Paraprevotella sp.]|nr:hypothetical protein [Paraprevotella sp.]